MNKLTLNECLDRIYKTHGDNYNYSLFTKYNGVKAKIRIICKKHGEFSQAFFNHVKGHGCSKCKFDKLSEIYKSNFKEFVAKAKIVHKNKYSYVNVKYTLAQNNVEIICPNHGSFSQTPANHLRGAGCSKCKSDILKLLFSDSLDDFIEKAKKIHNNYYSYKNTKYCGSDTKVEIVCPKHGSFFQTPHGHLTGRRCKSCAKVVSKKESKWLNFCNIPLRYRNIRFKVNGRWFNVDGIDPDTNTIYEFYGDFWHGNPEVYKPSDINKANKKSFGELYRRTIDKEMFLEKAGFAVVSIWENEFDKKGVR